MRNVKVTAFYSAEFTKELMLLFLCGLVRVI